VLPCGAGKTIVGAAAMAKAAGHHADPGDQHRRARQWKTSCCAVPRSPRTRSASTPGPQGDPPGHHRDLSGAHAPEGVYPHLDLLDARDWGLIVYDEVHLLPAPIFRMTADLQARRRLGLTATLVREDGREGDVFSLIGPKRFDAPWKDIEAQGWIAPADCVEVRVTLPDGERMAYAVAEPDERYRLADLHAGQGPRRSRPGGRHTGEPTLVIGQYLDQLDRTRRRLDAPLITGETTVGSGSGSSTPSARGDQRRSSSPRWPTSPSTCPRPRSRSRCRAPSAPARRRPSGSGGCCGPRPTAGPRTSTRSSPATRSTPTSPRTGSASSPSRAMPTGSSTPTTSGLDNVILTPHVGGSTQEAQEEIGYFVSNKLSNFIDAGSTELSVNLPVVAAPALTSGSRVAILHHNVPGVLAAVNQILFEHHDNVLAQYLATRGELGYVVADVEGPSTDECIAQIEATDWNHWVRTYNA
jgi:hypothetical protein